MASKRAACRRLHSQGGFTIAELLVAMVVGSIVMAAAFAAYSTFSRQYAKYIDQSDMHRSASQVLEVLAKDLRMAGAYHIDSPYGAIEIDVAIEHDSNAGPSKSDRIIVVYDEDEITRVKHHYEILACSAISPCSPDRPRLYKSRWEWSGTDWRQAYFRQPVADYVEDLQFRFNYEDGSFSDAPGDLVAGNTPQSVDVAVLVRAQATHLLAEKNQSFDLMDHSFSVVDKYHRANNSTVVQMRNLGGKL